MIVQQLVTLQGQYLTLSVRYQHVSQFRCQQHDFITHA